MTFCETCIHGEVCKYRSAMESIDSNLSSNYIRTGDWNIPDFITIQIKCEKFTNKTSPFTYRNEAGTNGGKK